MNIKMRIVLTALLFTIPLTLISCSSSAESKCNDIMKLTIVKFKKNINKLSVPQRTIMLAALEKRNDKEGMKACMEMTPEKRVGLYNKLIKM